MIPKIIHYCWFGYNEKPEFLQSCINTFSKKNPDWEIVEWNNDNIEYNSYVRYCFDKKYWVKISDFIRLKVLHDYGGIYLDTDVEVIKPLDFLLENKAFFSYESKGRINHAISGAEKGHWFLERCVDEFLRTFDGSQWNVAGGPIFITKMLEKYFKIPEYDDNVVKYGDDEVTIYPSRYFFPYYYTEKFDESCITKDTAAIHHWSLTWKVGTKNYEITHNK